MGATISISPSVAAPKAVHDFQVGDLVFVKTRCWIGMNKEGGVGRITRRYEPMRPDIDDIDDEDKQPTFDVTYVLGGKEQNIPAKFISIKRFEDVSSKSRSTMGRCSLPGCFSFVCDCKHDQQQKHIESVIQNIQRVQQECKPLKQPAASIICEVVSKPRKKTPQNIRQIRQHRVNCSTTPTLSSKISTSVQRPKKRRRVENQSDSELSDSGEQIFIQAEGTIVPPDIRQYAERKVASLNEEEQLAYFTQISTNLHHCLHKINKYAARGDNLLRQLPRMISNPECQDSWRNSARMLRRRYQKYLVNSHRKYIDVGNLIAGNFENRVSPALRKQFILAETEFTKVSQIVESRGIVVRKDIESLEYKFDSYVEVSFADNESTEEFFPELELAVTSPINSANPSSEGESDHEFIASDDELQIVSERAKRSCQSGEFIFDVGPNSSIEKEIEPSDINDPIFPIPHDQFFMADSNSSIDQNHNRVGALSLLDSLLELHQVSNEEPSTNVLISIISSLFHELSAIILDPSSWSEFLPKLFVIEIIWQQYAIRNEQVCCAIVEHCELLEHLLLSKFVISPRTCSTESINIFTFLKRKTTWVRLLILFQNYQQIDGADMSSRFTTLGSHVEDRIWFLLFYILFLFGDIILHPNSTSTPLYHDLLQLLNILCSKNFGDCSQLAQALYISNEKALGLEIKISLWSKFNYYVLQFIPIAQHSSYDSFTSGCQITSEPFHMPSFIGPINFFLNARSDSSLWASIWLLTGIQSNHKLQHQLEKENAPYAYIPSNWPLLKELTKDIQAFRPLLRWLNRVNCLLPLWENPSNGFDLYRELLGRLLKLELPWCSPLALSQIEDMHALRTQVLLVVDSYQSHINNSESPLLHSATSIFSPMILLDLFSHFSHSIGIVPPRYILEGETFELGEYVLPYALSLFSKGLQGIPTDSISFKRIQNRLSTLPLLCKDTSSLAAPVCLVSLLKCSSDMFGPSFYTESLHHTVVNIISSDTYTFEERQYLSWYICLVLFLPSQSQPRVSSTLGRLGFSFLFSVLQSVLEEILSGKKCFYSHILALVSLLPIIDGIHISNYNCRDDCNEKKVRIIFSLWNSTLRTGNHFDDGFQLRLCLCGMNRLFANLLSFLSTNSLDEIRVLVECIFSMFKDFLPVLRDVLINLITNCAKSGSSYRDSFHWRCGVIISRILGRVYWMIGYINDGKLTLGSVVELFRLPVPLPADEYPIDIWFKACFWSEISYQCRHFNSQDQKRLFCITDHVVLPWVGTLATMIAAPSVFEDIEFRRLHTFILSDEFLRKPYPNSNFSVFVCALIRLKSLNSFSQFDFAAQDSPGTREELLSFLGKTYQVLYAFVLTCTVDTYTRPVSERSQFKDIYRPLVDMLERAKSFITHRNSRGSTFEYPCQFASHLLSGWIGGSLLIPLSQVENLGRLCEVPLAFASNIEEFLIEHGTGNTVRDEPNPSHILSLLTLPHLTCGISFFSFSTRIFQCWKPLLRLLCVSRIFANLEIRTFLTRCWSVSLIDRKYPSSYLLDVLPRNWKNEFRRCNYLLFSQRVFFIASAELENTFPFDVNVSASIYETANFNSSLGAKYTFYSNLCLEKLAVFRDYVMSDDTLWDDPAVFLNSNTAVLASRTDLILDIFLLYCKLGNPLPPDFFSLGMLPNSWLAIALSSLRIVVLLLGYSLEDVMGPSQDSENNCMNGCLNNFYQGSCSINEVIEAILERFRCVQDSWKQFQRYFFQIFFEIGGLNDIIPLYCSNLRIFVSEIFKNFSNVSLSLRDECERMIGLVYDKITLSKYTRLVRMPSLANPDLVARCREFFEKIS